MTWFKVDDTLAFHGKVVAAGNEAMGLWVRAGAWSAQTLTDGFVPDHMVAAMCGAEPADALVEVGLWDRVDGGYRFHEWEQAQFSREKVLAKRESDRARKQRLAEERARKRDGERADSATKREGIRTESDATREGIQSASKTPVPSRPDPSRPVPTTSSAKPPAVAEPPREDVEALCIRLRDHIAGNTTKVPTITAKWRDSARLLLDRDGIPFDEAVRVLDWCQADDFWKPNILSMPKFREKFAALQIKTHQQGNVTRLPARQTASQRAQGHLDTVAEAERLMGLR